MARSLGLAIHGTQPLTRGPSSSWMTAKANGVSFRNCSDATVWIVNDTTVPVLLNVRTEMSVPRHLGQRAMGLKRSRPHVSQWNPLTLPSFMPSRCCFSESTGRLASKRSPGWPSCAAPLAASSSATCLATMSVPPRQDVHRDRAARCADVVRHGAQRVVDLAAAGFAHELLEDLDDLADTGCADGVTLGFQAATRVHGPASADARRAGDGFLRTGAALEQPQILGGHDLGDGEAVMHFPE